MSTITTRISTSEPNARVLALLGDSSALITRLRMACSPSDLSQFNPSAKHLLESFSAVSNGGLSQVVFACPAPFASLQVLHFASCLQRISACDRGKFTTLFFPWNLQSGTVLRDVLVDRDSLCSAIAEPLNRIRGSAEPWARYILSLQSLKSLQDSSKWSAALKEALESDPSLQHPSLFELFPVKSIRGGDVFDSAPHFLERLRKYIRLSPNKPPLQSALRFNGTPFFLIAISGDSTKSDALRRAGLDPQNGGRIPNVLLLDLSRKARTALGVKWIDRVSELTDSLIDIYVQAAPPIFAVTDDTFSLQQLRFTVLSEYDRLRADTLPQHKDPTRCQVTFNISKSMFGDSYPASGVSPRRVSAIVFGTYGLETIDCGVQLKRKLLQEGASDPAEKVAEACRVARYLLSLSGQPDEMFSFLREHFEGFQCNTRGSRYDYVAARAHLAEVVAERRAGRLHASLERFCEKFDVLIDSLNKQHPGRRHFDEILRSLIKKKQDAVVIMSDFLNLELVRWRIKNDFHLWDLKMAVENGSFVLADRGSASKLISDQGAKTSASSLVFIEPYFETLVEVLGSSALPHDVCILANHARADQLKKNFSVFLKLDSPALKKSLEMVADQLVQASAAHNSPIGDLDSELRWLDGPTIDLTADRPEWQGKIRLITLSSGTRLKVFDNSELLIFDASALMPWSKCVANQLKPDDEVCVFRDEFVDDAREILKFTADAPAALANYHRSIARAVSRLAGADIPTKAKNLQERMLAIDPKTNLPQIRTICEWIDVESLLSAPLEEVRPHAPQDRDHFNLFMKGLEFNEVLANQHWIYGVFATRSKRIKQGGYFHHVLTAALVDPDSFASQFPNFDPDALRRIDVLAQESVETLVDNEAIS